MECVLPPGKYYIGDICYVLDDDVYTGVWGKAKYANGVYEVDGNKFAVHMTAYGDGEYMGSNKISYCVDAGNIGIVPIKLCKANSEQDIEETELGSFYESDKEVHFRCYDGDFWIDDINIDTTGESEYDSEEEYDDDEDSDSDDEEEQDGSDSDA